MTRIVNLLLIYFSLFWLIVPPETAQATVTAESVHADIGDICMKILGNMSAVDFSIADIQQLASYKFPHDPLSRALKIYNSGTLGRNMVPFKYVPPRVVTTHQKRRGLKKTQLPSQFLPIRGNTVHREMRIIPNQELNNLQFISVRDRARDQPQKTTFVDPQGEKKDYHFFPYKPHEGTEIILRWFAGQSTVNSHAARVFEALEVTNAPSPKFAPMDILHNVGSNWVNVSALAGDVPLHGTGPFLENFFDAPDAMQWRKKDFENLKKFNLPLIAGARSSECMLNGQVALENPDLLKGMIWLGPTHPIAGFKEGLEGYSKFTDEYPPFISPKGLGAVLQARYQLISSPGPKWWTTDEWKTPTLIIVGTEDIEVSEKSRVAFRAWAKKFPNLVHYVEIPGAAHDPFSVSGDGIGGRKVSNQAAKERAQIAWEHVYWFLKKHGLDSSNVRLPAQNYLYHP